MIICDSREQKNAHILRYFERHGIEYQVRKMDTADYMVEGQPNIVVDRKQNQRERRQRNTVQCRPILARGAASV